MFGEFGEPTPLVQPQHSEQHQAMKAALSSEKVEAIVSQGRTLLTAAIGEIENPKYAVLGGVPVNDFIDFLRTNYSQAPDGLSGLVVDLKNKLDAVSTKNATPGHREVVLRIKENIDRAINLMAA